ncbi:hypothetical protein EVS84_07800 [Pseudomonas koreensis]|uniref:Uncharacterized protein n=1 Tax=Pseudomonas koreensis TaxID=198620 RepID=A0A4Q4L8C5_9PSED|nr:hypothetical protein EVS84_07800 [Pseudomonas koreensis]
MIWPGVWNRCNPQNPVGASLLAKAVGQSTDMLNVPTHSRASSLPQVRVVFQNRFTGRMATVY